ncbi:MAG TPA: DUF2961 domain-containing protein [Polyangiaceae bacterium]|nr:DUF2961 domain-containing protein [Polyangiaceae bacterium]
MWTRGAVVCSLLVVVPACTNDGAALPGLDRLPPPTLDPGARPTTAGEVTTTPRMVREASVDASTRGTSAEHPRPPPMTASDGGDASPTTPVDSGADGDSAALVDRGVAAFSWESIPALGTERYREFTSYDRDEMSNFPLVPPGNKDFNNWLAICGDRPTINYGSVVGTAPCDANLEGYLIASDDSGPGFVSRFFFTHSDFDANAPKDQEKIRIYVDDLSAPVYEGKLVDWQNGTDATFKAPLAEWTSGALVSYVPISYSSRLRILLDDLSPTAVYYYHVGLKTSEPTLPFSPDRVDVAAIGAQVKAEATRGAGRAVWVDSSRTLDANATVTVLDRQGPGTIESVKFTVTNPTVQGLSTLLLRATWDDEGSPALELPLALLFGQLPKLADFETLPMAVKTNGTTVTLTISLPMPFATRARLQVVNTSTATQPFTVHVEGTDQSVEHAGRLHVDTPVRRAPMQPGTRFPIATLSGKGRYVGALLLLEGQADTSQPISSPLNFLEGDQVLTVDGDLVAHGTGTEDFLDAGWYFMDGPFSSPFAALASTTGLSQSPGEITAVRWQVMTDAVDFQSSLSLSLEYGTNQPSTAIQYASVTFYYLDPK